MRYSSREMMAIIASREIKADEIVFCGTGLPMLAAMTAKHLHAPDSVIFFETGAIDSRLEEIPLTVADPRVIYKASVASGLIDAFNVMQNRFTGPKVLGILSAAQIDRYGNLNSTCIGDYHRPKVRMPGSGGACDVASLVGRVMIFMRQERRRFVEKLDYFTSPGWVGPGDERMGTGLVGGGPELVVTDLGVLRFHPDTHEMYLDRYYSNTTPEEVVKKTGFKLEIQTAEEASPPTDRELKILREVVDPQRLILGGED